MLDLKTNQWEQINLKGCPSPRSGHRMVIVGCHASLISAEVLFIFYIFYFFYFHNIFLDCVSGLVQAQNYCFWWVL